MTKNGEWRPTEEEKKEKSWEVEPKDKKEDEVFVWGVCDDDGESFLYEIEPKKVIGIWNIAGDCMKLDQDNLFPKDEPKKYKLVEVK